MIGFIFSAELLEAPPGITAADLVNVLADADAHPEKIAIALGELEAAMEEDV